MTKCGINLSNSSEVIRQVSDASKLFQYHMKFNVPANFLNPLSIGSTYDRHSSQQKQPPSCSSDFTPRILLKHTDEPAMNHRPASSNGRTPLFTALRRAARQVRSGVQHPPEVREHHPVSRRTFLQVSSMAAGGLLFSPMLAGCGNIRPLSGSDPRIAIVGGGMAGLTAAWHLSRAGLQSTIYESSSRIGGRVHTGLDVVAPGHTTELGGEFIDSIHADMIALCGTFDLPLIDRHEGPAADLDAAYFFNGRHYDEDDIIAGFQDAASRVIADLDAAETDDAFAILLDLQSVAGYLDALDLDDWLHALLDVAFVTEYGLDAEEQSALNFIYTIGTDFSDGFSPFGESDERFKIEGGNERLPHALASALEGQIETGQVLEAVRRNGAGYVLNFQAARGFTEVAADVVILAIPLPRLRQIDLHVDLLRIQRQAIAEAGFGTNAKLFAGMRSRPWRTDGFSAEAFSDEGYQLVWDPSELIPGDTAGLTLYSGGTPGVQVGTGSPEEQVARLLPGVERTFPGVANAYTGQAARFHWPTHPHTLGSYTCFRPGEWTTFAEALPLATDGLFFAGEHCSIDFQGYMNGAAESGRKAAEAIVDFLGRPSLSGAEPAVATASYQLV